MPGPLRTSPRPVVRVRSTADLVASVPYLVGFTPRHSVVIVSLRGPHLRCGMVARVDLPPAQDDLSDSVDALVAALVPPIVRDGAAQVAVVVHDDAPWDPEQRPHEWVVDRLEDAFGEFGITVKEAAYVGDERFWSYTCALDACCPAAGRALAELDGGIVPATFVAEGRAPATDRAAVVAQVSPRGPLLSAAVGSVAERESRWRGTDRRQEVLKVFETLVARRMDGGVTATPDEAGLVLAGLVDVHVRDAVAQRHCAWLGDLGPQDANLRSPGHEPPSARSERGDPWADPVTAVLQDLATCCDGDWAVAPLTLLALQHWQAGQGALANACIDRALALDPAYRMARLAEQLLRAGVPPRWVGALRRAEADHSPGEAS